MSHTIELSTDRWPDTTSLSCLILLKSQAWLNRVPVAEDSEEMQLFLGFIKACGGLTAYRTEWMIFSESHRLAGSIDFVAMDCDQNLVLFDWKRSKGLRHKYQCRYGQMLGPLSHMPDCQGMHYRLQLNCYKFMLELNYGVHVSDMYVVCTHPDNGREAFVDRVPILAHETAALMDHQRARVLETAAMTTEDTWDDPWVGVLSSQEFSEEIHNMLDEDAERVDGSLREQDHAGGDGESASKAVLAADEAEKNSAQD
jgi:hypothetical protein